MSAAYDSYAPFAGKIVALPQDTVELGAETWGLARVVSELRSTRTARGRRELPSREALVGIVEALRAALFPAHFGPADLTDAGLDYFVGHTLDVALSSLHEQARRALRFEGEAGDAASQATEIVRAFAARLPAVRALLDTDVRAAYESDPSAHSPDEALFCYPGVTAITHHRLAHELYGLGVPLLARIVSEIAHGATGIDIHPGAQIGESFFIDHGTGVVIGETSIIGARVRLFQGVTLGAKSFPLDDQAKPIKGAMRHPIVEDDVVIYSGATVLGRITLGRGSTIGGNVWITRSVPAGSRITQAQAHHESFDEGAGI
ncbi:Serine acetyltransferase [Minicystis rosea]|nr:Serine acetyltransferase [Minicystis rosea]